MPVKKIKISALVPDDCNFNTGTEYGGEMIERSLSKFGAGRSIVIDKNGNIIAGNKTVENAIKAGIDEVIIVESDGTSLVAVKRLDVGLDSKIGRELALADNATAKENIHFDVASILNKAKELDMIPSDWGFSMPSEYIPSYDPAEDEGEPCMCPECLHEFTI